MKTFSIVIPYYNLAHTLPRSLSSIAAQTFRPIQLILVDNGSTDQSYKICQEFKEKHQSCDLTIITTNESLQGAATARNTGLQRVTGEWVVFFDSDDEMSPTFLSDVQEAFERTKANVVATSTYMIFPNGKKKKRVVYHTKSVADQILTGMLATQGMCFQTEYLKKLGGWHPVPIWNDWLLGINLLLDNPKLTWLPQSYHYIHQHPNSITGRSFSENYEKLKYTLSETEKILTEAPNIGKREMAAFTARKVILAGQLYREGNFKIARQLFLESIMNKRKELKGIICRFLFTYTRLGGRGAWWLARLLLPQ